MPCGILLLLLIDLIRTVCLDVLTPYGIVVPNLWLIKKDHLNHIRIDISQKLNLFPIFVTNIDVTGGFVLLTEFNN